MKILAIETSCDETAVALISASGGLNPPAGGPRFKILADLVSSQIAVHRPFGGVVPNLAKREHLKNLPLLWRRILNNELRIKNKKSVIRDSKFATPKIDLIAVTVGPGLEPALWTGIEFAKNLRKRITDDELRIREGAKRKKSVIRDSKFIIPIRGVNHLEGHLYSFLLNSKFQSASRRTNSKLFPAIALIVSGGHTMLLLMKSLIKVKKIGETRDDAAGEAFDKVARLLGLPYPGGPEIAKIATQGNPDAVSFPRPMLDQKNYDFSFSGLKTAVLYHLRSNVADLDEKTKADVAASFQKAAVDVLVQKTLRAAREFGAKSVMLSGGVAANKALREGLAAAVKKNLTGGAFVVPDMKHCGDNAAMIAAAAYVDFLRGKKRRLIARSDISF